MVVGALGFAGIQKVVVDENTDWRDVSSVRFWPFEVLYLEILGTSSYSIRNPSEWMHRRRKDSILFIAI